jgi:xanthine dehydrogenase YagS FAD-binding subunit
LAAAAVALDLRDGTIVEARIGLGGLAYRPWRSHEAEAVLKGQRFDEDLAGRAAGAAFAGARGRDGNSYKIELGRRTLARALIAAARLEV